MSLVKNGHADQHKLVASAFSHRKIDRHLDTPVNDLPRDLKMAFRHYCSFSRDENSALFFDCHVCAESTLADLMYSTLNCREALSLHATLPVACKEEIFRSWPGEHAETIGQLAAIEHIWGRPPRQEVTPLHSNLCQEEPCRKLRFFRREMVIEEMKEYEEILYLLKLFLTRGWPIERVFLALHEQYLLPLLSKEEARLPELEEFQEINDRLNRLVKSCRV